MYRIFPKITYPDTTTQIPSHYEYTYFSKGSKITDSFDNINPDGEVKEETTTVQQTTTAAISYGEDLSAVDTNGNG